MSSLQRLFALSRAEWLQFRRNKTILFMSLVFPVGMPLLVWLSMGPESAADKRTAGGMMIEIYFLMSLFVVLFYSVLSMSTTRRDERVLKRLRTGEARDWEILTAIAVPGALLTTGLFILIATIAIVLGSVPVAIPLVVIALLLGMLVFGTLGFLTCSFTKNAEAAQLTSMPVMALAMVSMSNLRQAIPEQVNAVLDRLPVAQVYDVAVLGWSGVDRDDLFDATAPLPLTDVYSRAGGSITFAIIWIAILIWSVSIYMRWDTHRG